MAGAGQIFWLGVNYVSVVGSRLFSLRLLLPAGGRLVRDNTFTLLQSRQMSGPGARPYWPRRPSSFDRRGSLATAHLRETRQRQSCQRFGGACWGEITALTTISARSPGSTSILHVLEQPVSTVLHLFYVDCRGRRPCLLCTTSCCRPFLGTDMTCML